jgi:hypothetical protein
MISLVIFVRIKVSLRPAKRRQTTSSSDRITFISNQAKLTPKLM